MNKYLITLVVAGFTFLTGSSVNAQKTKAEIYGLGRAVVEFDEMKGETVVDSTGEGKGSGGYTLLDLGFKVQKDKILKADMIMRIRNEYGGFYVNGQKFDFRQLRLEGVLGGAVKYAVGDLDMVLTPYTLYNSDLEFHKYESDIFAIRRDVVNYEWFYTDESTWRTQGVDMSFALKFAKGIEKLGFRAFGNRIVAANTSASTPDRWIFGGRVDIEQSKSLKIGLNALSLRDMGSTVSTPSFEYKNDAYTVDGLATYNEIEKIKFDLGGEVGVSKYSSKDNALDSTVTYNDGFYETYLKMTYKPLNIYLKALYKSVGAKFSSPTAQTRRINDFGALQIYPNYTNQVDPRSVALLDRTSQEAEGVYSKSFAANLMSYNPIFGNINPYGEASPNRQGLELELGIIDTNFYELNVMVQSKQEITIINPDVVTGATDKRKFTGIEIGGKLYLNQFLNYEKEISVIGGVRHEKTSRNGLSVDLTSTQIDAGLDIEPVRRLHVLFGYKKLVAKGNEYNNNRNAFNEIEGSPVNTLFDLENTVLAWGLVYDFNYNAQFSISGNYQKWNNKVDYTQDLTDNDYYGNTPYNFNMSQIYVNYTQRF